MLVGYEIYDENGGFSRFSFSENSLKLSVDELCRWVEFNSEKFINRFNISEVSLFKDYMKLLVLVHEVEHSYQYLMAYGLIDAPCEVISSGYRLIIDTILNKDKNSLKRFSNAISYYLYNKNDGGYVIERNANVEAFDLLQNLALINNHDELANVFNRMRNLVGILGYTDDNRGSFDETFRKIKKYNEYKKLNHNFQLSDIDRFRYGLPISKEFRGKIRVIKK